MGTFWNGLPFTGGLVSEIDTSVVVQSQGFIADLFILVHYESGPGRSQTDFLNGKALFLRSLHCASIPFGSSVRKTPTENVARIWLPG